MEDSNSFGHSTRKRFILLVEKTDDKLYWVCEARLWRQGGYGGEFCGKLPEVSPMSDRANGSQLQDGHTTGQSLAHQWQHLWDNVFKEKKRVMAQK